MKKPTNNQKTTSAKSILVLTFIAIFTMSSLSVIGFAQNPVYPEFKTTYTYITAAPNPTGIGQPALIVFWADQPPPTAHGAYGDRYTFTVEVTKPDGTIQNLGTFTSDPVGGSWIQYTPETIGTYYFQATFQGIWIYITGEEWYIPSGARDLEPGDYYYKPSTSAKASLTVQQEPIEAIPGVPLPTDYWTRPINPMNREWYAIAGNWLNDGTDNHYTKGPESAHIVWTKELFTGGIVGGDTDKSYYTGSSYERKWSPPVIIQGRLYYNQPLSDKTYQSRDLTVLEGQKLVCVDLRTGEELWAKDGVAIDFGQIYWYDSPNQHGAIPYLWRRVTSSREMMAYDPFTGEWLYTITNVPSGTSAVGPAGEPLIYQMNSGKRWLALWNASAIPELLLSQNSGTDMWQWRPVGKTVDGVAAYSWNVTIPDLSGAQNPTILSVLDDRIIGHSGLTTMGGRYGTVDPWTMWAISLKPGQEGQLLWKKDYPAPPGNQTIQIGPMSIDDGVFIIRNKETLSFYAYDLDTGNMLWGPSKPVESWMMYGSIADIAYGKLYVTGWSGVVHCYDLKTGNQEWEFSLGATGLETVYPNWPVGSGAGMTIADEKIYVTTGEHSHTQPLYRAWVMHCIDAKTGEGIWNITDLSSAPALADGYAVTLNDMDGRIYGFGKGQTAITIDAPLTAVPLGSSVMIRGTVTDQSPGAKDTPAIADESMKEWMEYLYMQKQMPMSAKGVEVKLEALDPNMNFYEIGTVTSDTSSMFKLMWKPPVPGEYTIIATFEGSDSYFSSFAETAIGVDEAPSPSTPIEPEPTETPLITTEIAIIAAVVVACIIGIVAFFALRKRK
jgi:outer membrane protein assembly factor BamB